jgi:hypothetical protein
MAAQVVDVVSTQDHRVTLIAIITYYIGVTALQKHVASRKGNGPGKMNLDPAKIGNGPGPWVPYFVYKGSINL